MNVLRQFDRIASATGLDPAVSVLRRVGRLIPQGSVRDALHGVWLGHPLHPALVELPIGSWLCAGALDMRGRHDDARFLSGVGVAAAIPAATAGLVDYSDQHEDQMRVGVVHAAANSAALALYSASLLVARRRLARGLGPGPSVMLRFAGLSAAGLGAALGGHLAYRQAAGANHAESVPYLVPPGWQRLGTLEEFPEHTPQRATVGDVPVVAVRTGDSVQVLSSRCAHLDGPLTEGTVNGEGIVCPWHGSVFNLDNGEVVHGPATAPQPSFDTRVRNGTVEVRLPTPS